MIEDHSFFYISGGILFAGMAGILVFVLQLNARLRASRESLKKETAEHAKAVEELRRSNEEVLRNEEAVLNMLYDAEQLQQKLNSTQAQLVQSEKLAAIGQLAAGVAHEINNPIAFVTTNVDALGQYVGVYGKLLKLAEELAQAVDAGDQEKVQALSCEIHRFRADMQLDFIEEDTPRLIEESKNGLDRVKKIINDLRIFARSNQGQKELTTLDGILESVLGIVWNEIKYKAELKKEYGVTPQILCDGGKIGQVFVNILVNAAQAIREHGEIVIRTYTEGIFACVDISDTGNGIPDENLKKVFDPFFTTKPVGQGTGLGLSVSYDIVKEHGGEIRVRSELGRGTTFTVALPKAESPSISGQG